MGDNAYGQFGFVQLVFAVIAFTHFDADETGTFLNIQLVLVNAFGCQQLH
ncbi:hypothetical protein [Neisseria meningitidis]|nr:hypothetical protein [Neisseria meningitidis]MCL6056160.1 hypothetical protein [Neisseria meningitidis]